MAGPDAPARSKCLRPDTAITRERLQPDLNIFLEAERSRANSATQTVWPYIRRTRWASIAGVRSRSAWHQRLQDIL